MENTANHITLTGTLASLPEYSHQNHEREIFPLSACRRAAERHRRPAAGSGGGGRVGAGGIVRGRTLYH